MELLEKLKWTEVVLEQTLSEGRNSPCMVGAQLREGLEWIRLLWSPKYVGGLQASVSLASPNIPMPPSPSLPPAATVPHLLPWLPWLSAVIPAPSACLGICDGIWPHVLSVQLPDAWPASARMTSQPGT
eukprot:515055-Pelagomonas_calceolata.AAC.8